jgi:hypothetical protein
MFFGPTHREKDVKALFKILEENVDWKIALYVPNHFKKSFIQFSKIRNINITIIPVNVVVSSMNEQIRHKLYDWQLSTPFVGTVAIFATYVSLQLGYNEINIYGIDHNYFSTLAVNSDNELGNIEEHFFDKEIKFKRIINNNNNLPYDVYTFLYMTSMMFLGHNQMAKYGQYKNVKIFNCTENSMVDSYNRKEIQNKHETLKTHD